MEEVAPKQAAGRRGIGNENQTVNETGDGETECVARNRMNVIGMVAVTVTEGSATEGRVTAMGDRMTECVAIDRMIGIEMVAVIVVEGTEDREALVVLLSSGCSTKITTVNSASKNCRKPLKNSRSWTQTKMEVLIRENCSGEDRRDYVVDRKDFEGDRRGSGDLTDLVPVFVLPLSEAMTAAVPVFDPRLNDAVTILVPTFVLPPGGPATDPLPMQDVPKDVRMMRLENEGDRTVPCSGVEELRVVAGPAMPNVVAAAVVVPRVKPIVAPGVPASWKDS